MTAGRYRGSAAVWALLIVYASLYPFVPLRLPAAEAVTGFFTRPKYVTEFDVALNVLAYAPFGALVCLAFRQSGTTWRAIAKAAGLGAALSFAMESLQLFVPGRIASFYDVIANAAGALWGALIFAEPLHSLVTRPLGAARERLVVAGAWGDAGLVLVALWLIAQVNPALPFFGAGNISAGAGSPDPLALLQWVAVAMSVCGFGLFVSALLVPDHGTLRATVVLLSVALWFKFVAASLMLQPHFAEEWLSAGRMAGLAAGLALLWPLRRIPRSGRIYLAFVLVLAGALFAKIFGQYSAIDELLHVFRWPYGQLANFTTLTRYLHESWPLLAVIYLIALFFRARRSTMQ